MECLARITKTLKKNKQTPENQGTTSCNNRSKKLLIKFELIDCANARPQEKGRVPQETSKSAITNRKGNHLHNFSGLTTVMANS